MSGPPERERRETPLAAILKDRIRREGPITVADYVRACLLDPQYGYYRTRPAIGADGDFVTAPEITQVFGELIGLWSAVVWQQMGAPAGLDVLELGPGRGTMMHDALRATRIVPGFHEALAVHLIESSEALQAQQQKVLDGSSPSCHWHSSLGDYVEAAEGSGRAVIVIGNEFLDTCPVSQFEAADGHVYARGVGLDENGALAFVRLAAEADDIDAGVTLGDGDVFERQDFGFAGAVVTLARARPSFAALFLDYGHRETHAGDTLQAIRRHRSEHPLCSPGEADLTVQVDFAAFRRAVDAAANVSAAGDAPRDHGAIRQQGPVTQAEFLGRLGIMERASRLMAHNPDKALAIETGVARLMAPSGMGSRFKAVAISHPALAPLPGFALP